MAPEAHVASMAVAALCHVCTRPTIMACRACGRPACEGHLGPGLVCVACLPGKRSMPSVAR